ncbi:MAG: hypothetical protein MZW92_09250 [Comamonadaceae bacterium]|nr:hypothetical protein [Comamonadaceae bacterium]
MMLEQGYYYPPYLQLETYLDTLSRSDLLEIAQQLLATEYPAQRLIRRQVGEYLEAMQRLRNEQERLNAELTWRIDEMANLGAEREAFGDLGARLARRTRKLSKPKSPFSKTSA